MSTIPPQGGTYPYFEGSVSLPAATVSGGLSDMVRAPAPDAMLTAAAAAFPGGPTGVDLLVFHGGEEGGAEYAARAEVQV